MKSIKNKYNRVSNDGKSLNAKIEKDSKFGSQPDAVAGGSTIDFEGRTSSLMRTLARIDSSSREAELTEKRTNQANEFQQTLVSNTTPKIVSAEQTRVIFNQVVEEENMRSTHRDDQ